MHSTKWNPRPSHDPYLVEDPSDSLPPDLSVEKGEVRPRQLLKRAIVHPRFKNVDRETAEALLGQDTVPVGDFFFRPSSTSYAHLKLSWKFWADVFVHIDVKELDKPNNNNWSLGRRLQIEQDFYDDLDDVVANFVDNIVNYAASVREHRRFKVCH
jgi:transcription elongation factor SPT6